MNKKLFLGMFAAAGMLLATSCSNDELDVVQSGNEAQVTFNLGTEGGIATRAISDGLNAKKLVCAVYDANGTLLDEVVINDKQPNAYGQFETTEAFQGGRTDQIKVTLAKGQEYTMVFWAQHKDCDAYNTNDLTAVKVSYKAENGTDNASNNDDTRDAFYAAETFKVEGNKEINVTLKRPFAQVNVGVYKSDWEAAEASGITIKESSVVIKNVADEINLLTGAVKASDAMENGITYALNAIPNDPAILKADANKDGEDEEYQWLSMSYILVNDIDASVDENGLLGTDKALLEGLQFTFKPESGQSITFEEGLAGAPVRRNWRTNILGKILTGDIQFNITIDNEFNEEDYIYPDGSIEQELEFAAAFGGTVTLSDNVTLTEPLNVTADMILNLNGYTISNEKGYAIENTANLTIYGDEKSGISGLGGIRSKGGKITINGGAYTGSSNWSTGTYQHILKAENTEVVINGGTFDATKGGTNNAMINVSENSVVTVNGGTFKNVNGEIPQFAPYMFTYEKNGKLVINDGDFYGGWRFNGATATTDIYGGNFTVSYDGQSFHASSTHVLKIYGGTFSIKNGGRLNPGNYLAEGYTAVKNSDGTWTVAKKVENPADLRTALAEGGIVALSADVTLSDVITLDKETTIYLNGNKLDASSNTSRPFTVTDGANLTIEATDAEIECGANGLVNMTEGTLTINGGSFNQTQGNNGAFIRVSGDEEMAINLNNVTYKAGTTDSGVLRTSGSNVTVNVNGGVYEAGMGFLLENGSINGAEITATNTANMWPAVYADGDITVTGCTIKSACHAVAVGGGNTLTVANCNVTPADGKLAFQVFSSGGTINVTNSTYTGGYGTTGKINSGSPDAVITINGTEVYRKSAQ